MKYPNVNLPDYFTTLLQSNLQTTGTALENLRAYIASNKSFAVLVEKSFKHIDERSQLTNIIKSLGWYGFRDSLAALFVEYQMVGKFPEKPNRDLVKDIVAFEDYVKKYTVAGYSRGFLLAFYIKMGLLYHNDERFSESLVIGHDLIDLLDNAQAKTIKIDWLLFTLKHADYFLGRDKLVSCIDNKTNYEDLYESFSEEQKELFVDNLLSYGSSIGDSNIFFSKTI